MVVVVVPEPGFVVGEPVVVLLVPVSVLLVLLGSISVPLVVGEVLVLSFPLFLSLRLSMSSFPCSGVRVVRSVCVLVRSVCVRVLSVDVVSVCADAIPKASSAPSVKITLFINTIFGFNNCAKIIPRRIPKDCFPTINLGLTAFWEQKLNFVKPS